jgi:hypothetical protein
LNKKPVRTRNSGLTHDVSVRNEKVGGWVGVRKGGEVVHTDSDGRMWTEFNLPQIPSQAVHCRGRHGSLKASGLPKYREWELKGNGEWGEWGEKGRKGGGEKEERDLSCVKKTLIGV